MAERRISESPRSSEPGASLRQLSAPNNTFSGGAVTDSQDDARVA